MCVKSTCRSSCRSSRSTPSAGRWSGYCTGATPASASRPATGAQRARRELWHWMVTVRCGLRRSGHERARGRPQSRQRAGDHARARRGSRGRAGQAAAGRLRVGERRRLAGFVDLQQDRGIRRGRPVPWRRRGHRRVACQALGAAAQPADEVGVPALRRPCGAASAGRGVRPGVDGRGREPDTRPGQVRRQDSPSARDAEPGVVRCQQARPAGRPARARGDRH